MARIVMKFGGTSVADMDRIRNVARHVKREVDAGNKVADAFGATRTPAAQASDAAPSGDSFADFGVNGSPVVRNSHPEKPGCRD